MQKIKIGIIKEGKVPVDHRVPLTPQAAKQLVEKFDNVEVLCQASTVRCYEDSEYKKLGIRVVDRVDDCDVLMGVKEVPITDLIEGKTYFFFSHTTKKQPYNRELLRAILKKNIRLVDYENLTNIHGERIVAFGRYAGIVGAYNGVLTYGKRYNLFDLKPAHQCFDMAEMQREYAKVKLPPIKIVLTGGGRVAKGAMEVLDGMGIRKINPSELVSTTVNEAVYAQLNTEDYNVHKEGRSFDREEFYANPQNYRSNFLQYAQAANLFIAGAFWDPKAPVLFTKKDALDQSFSIRVIADITCDIEGSIPSTKKPSTIDHPIYDYNPQNDAVVDFFSDENNITVMAVDNLPCELPRNASEDFGKDLLNNVMGALLGDDAERIIQRATIAENGELTPKYKYLQDYVEGKS